MIAHSKLVDRVRPSFYLRATAWPAGWGRCQGHSKLHPVNEPQFRGATAARHRRRHEIPSLVYIAQASTE